MKVNLKGILATIIGGGAVAYGISSLVKKNGETGTVECDGYSVDDVEAEEVEDSYNDSEEE